MKLCQQGMFEFGVYRYKWMAKLAFLWHRHKKTPNRIFLPELHNSCFNGWVEIDKEKFLLHPWTQFSIESALAIADGMSMAAIEEFNKSYSWHLIKHRTPSETMDFLSRVRLADQSDVQATKLVLTVSALLYDCPIPEEWLHYDSGAYINFLLTYAMTHSLILDMKQMRTRDFLPIEDFQKLIREFFSSGLIDYLVRSSKPANFFAAKEYFKVAFARYPEEHNLPLMKRLIKQPDADNKIKKILTAIFLNTIKTVPADYIYLDIEVADMISKSGDYEVVKPQSVAKQS